MDITINLPKTGGGAIIQLFDKEGTEIYNSGFQYNDLTDEGIWGVVSPFSANTYQANNQQAYGMNPLFFYNNGGNEPQIYINSPSINRARKNSLTPRPKVLENRYMAMDFVSEFAFGEVIGEVNRVGLCDSRNPYNELTIIDLQSPVTVTNENQVVITYTRIVDLKGYVKFEDGAFVEMERIVIDGDYSSNISEIHYNPLLNYTTSNTFNGVYVKGPYSIASSGNYGTLELKLGDSTTYSRRYDTSLDNRLYSQNKEALEGTLTLTNQINPTDGHIEFDAISIVFVNNALDWDSGIVIEFIEPIIKTRNDVFKFDISITLKGSKDSIDLSEIEHLLN